MNKLRKLECHMYSWACCRNRAIRCESGTEWMRRAVAQGAIGGLLLRDRVILRDGGADSAPVEVLGGFARTKKKISWLEQGAAATDVNGASAKNLDR